MNPHELKALETRLKQAEAELPGLKATVSEAQRQHDAKLKQVRELRKRIEEAKGRTKATIVSEHAMLRFLERVVGIDLAALRQQVLPADTEEKIRVLGNGRYPATYDGRPYYVCVKGNTVTTVEKESLEG